MHFANMILINVYFFSFLEVLSDIRSDNRLKKIRLNKVLHIIHKNMASPWSDSDSEDFGSNSDNDELIFKFEYDYDDKILKKKRINKSQYTETHDTYDDSNSSYMIDPELPLEIELTEYSEEDDAQVTFSPSRFLYFGTVDYPIRSQEAIKARMEIGHPYKTYKDFAEASEVSQLASFFFHTRWMKIESQNEALKNDEDAQDSEYKGAEDEGVEDEGVEDEDTEDEDAEQFYFWWLCTRTFLSILFYLWFVARKLKNKSIQLNLINNNKKKMNFSFYPLHFNLYYIRTH